MKLVYFYIQSYGCLHDRGFLFDARYSVTTKMEKDGIHVSVKETEDCLDNILYGNVSLTAIVGDNGAGKSTCLDALQAWLVDFDNNPGLVIWENDENLFYQSDSQCKVKIDKNGIELKEYRGGETPLPLNAVFFSDVLDDRGERAEVRYDGGKGTGIVSFKDVSTSAKLNEIEEAREMYPSQELYRRDSLFQIRLADQLKTNRYNFPWNDIFGEKRLEFLTINAAKMKELITNRNKKEYKKSVLIRLLSSMNRKEKSYSALEIIRESIFLAMSDP